MAKKVRFRLWFQYKLNIKRFSNSASHRKRRNVPSSPPHHPIHSFSATSASPQAFHISFNSSPDQNSVSAVLPSPSHSLPLTFSSPRHTSPATSPQGFRRASFSVPSHSRKSSKPSQNQATFHTFVHLSPINRKAMDIAYPSGGSSPATSILQSPIFQAAIARPGASVSSPPMRKPHSHTVLFKSPLHPLAHMIFANLSSDAKAISTQSSAINSSREARISARSSRKAEISVNPSRKTDVPAFHSQALAKESNLITDKHSRAQQRRSLRASSVKQSPLIVDCGCRPNLSSSFRKTKKTLQACGSCSSNKPGIIPVYDHHIAGAMQTVKGRSSMNIGEESKKSMAACISGKQDTCTVLAKQGHHSQDSLRRHQLKRRKRKMDVTINASLTKPDLVHTSPVKSVTNEHIDRDIHKIKAKRGLEDADCNPADTKLASSFRLSTPSRDAALVTDACAPVWEKECSSITSEDTFFSSFDRSRPSFSSNSSSECFDKKLSFTNPALSYANLVSNDANVPSGHVNSLTKRSTDNLNYSNPTRSYGTLASKEGSEHRNLSSFSCKVDDSLVEVSFHGDDGHGHDGVATLTRKGTPTCVQVASQCTPCINTNYGTKRSCFNPLVEIKEDLSEESNTNTIQLGKNHGSRGCKSGPKALNLQKKLSIDHDYTSSSHSDYYGNTRHTDMQRSAQVRKKSDVNQNKGTDTGSARIRRRAQLQAKWRLHEEQIHWQSTGSSEGGGGDDDDDDDDDDEDAHNVRCSTSELRPRAKGDIHSQNLQTLSRRRKTQDVKVKRNNLIDSSIVASKAASTAVDNTASCGAAQPMLSSDTSASQCEGEREKISQYVNLSRQSSFATNPRLVDSVAVVKCSKDPLVDFRDSMVDMIIEKQIYSANDLQELLQCFLSLNSSEHHDVILQAFAQVWEKVFHESRY